MEKPPDLESKYHTLATEYSKIRSQAAVLKKAVLEEQAKVSELREVAKEQEKKIRRHDHEMESLTFRNDQLTKRIGVLQQDLQQENDLGRKGKGKKGATILLGPAASSVIDEELQKKILENAQLASSAADKDMELMNNQERIQLLERDVARLQNELQKRLDHHSNELRKLKSESDRTHPEPDATCVNCRRNCETEAKELERWKQECEMLRSRPEQNDERLTDYYETKIRDLFDEKQAIHSEASSMWAENKALCKRLERASIEKAELKEDMERGIEEFRSSSDNYKSQLDAMTEHLAVQNEKITRQCDEIEALKMRVASRK